MPPFRNSASFGKRQEMVVFGELLRRGYDVYLTLVDDQQIDCIVRFGDRDPKAAGRYRIVFTNTNARGEKSADHS